MGKWALPFKRRTPLGEGQRTFNELLPDVSIPFPTPCFPLQSLVLNAGNMEGPREWDLNAVFVQVHALT
jgi:hypothetical protein